MSVPSGGGWTEASLSAAASLDLDFDADSLELFPAAMDALAELIHGIQSRGVSPDSLGQ